MEITETTVFVYRGFLGIKSDFNSEGLLNEPLKKGIMGFMLDASKVKFSETAIAWLKKVRPSDDDIGEIMIYKRDDNMIVFAWMGGPLTMLGNPNKTEGQNGYNPDLLTSTENVEIPESFKEAVDKHLFEQFKVEKLTKK